METRASGSLKGYQEMSVSVIVPVFNREKLIQRAVESALTQSNPPVEVIAIDDGSSDKTVEILQGIPEVTLLRNEGRPGPAGARNTGIKRAKGDYLAFLDSDDFWKSNKLELQISRMEKEGIYFSFTQVDFENYPPHIEEGLLERENIFEKLLSRNFICTSSVVLHRKVIERVGMFDEQFFGTEDLDLWARAALVFDSLFISEPLGTYSRDDDSIKSLSGLREGQIVDRVNDRIRILAKLRQTLPLNLSQRAAVAGALSEIYFNLGYDRSLYDPLAAGSLYLRSLQEAPSFKVLGALLKLPVRFLRGGNGSGRL